MPVSHTTVRTTHAFAPLQTLGDIFSYIHLFFPPLIYLAGLAFPFLKVDMELLNSPNLNSAQSSLGDSGKKNLYQSKKQEKETLLFREI